MKLVFNKKNKDIFEMLRSGEKKIETRAATSKYKRMRAGEQVTFACAGETFERMVSKVSYFDSIRSLLKAYPPESINPKTSTEEEITAMCYSFPGYEEKIRACGIAAIEFKEKARPKPR
jgi:ASC-1-like (ASCH) protein